MSNIITRGFGRYNFVITRGYGLLNRFFDVGKTVITGQRIPPKIILKNTPDKALLGSDKKLNILQTIKGSAILKTIFPDKAILKNTNNVNTLKTKTKKVMLKSDIKINPLNTKKDETVLKTKPKNGNLTTRGR